MAEPRELKLREDERLFPAEADRFDDRDRLAEGVLDEPLREVDRAELEDRDFVFDLAWAGRDCFGAWRVRLELLACVRTFAGAARRGTARRGEDLRAVLPVSRALAGLASRERRVGVARVRLGEVRPAFPLSATRRKVSRRRSLFWLASVGRCRSVTRVRRSGCLSVWGETRGRLRSATRRKISSRRRDA